MDARFTLDLFEQWFDEEVGLLAEVPNIAEAARLMHNMIVADDLVEFLTLPAYELLDSTRSRVQMLGVSQRHLNFVGSSVLEGLAPKIAA